MMIYLQKLRVDDENKKNKILWVKKVYGDNR